MLELHGTAFGAMQQSYGGDTFNTAVYLARCGGESLAVHYATALGDDSLSQELLRRWAVSYGCCHKCTASIGLRVDCRRVSSLRLRRRKLCV